MPALPPWAAQQTQRQSPSYGNLGLPSPGPNAGQPFPVFETSGDPSANTPYPGAPPEGKEAADAEHRKNLEREAFEEEYGMTMDQWQAQLDKKKREAELKDLDDPYRHQRELFEMIFGEGGFLGGMFGGGGGMGGGGGININHMKDGERIGGGSLTRGGGQPPAPAPNPPQFPPMPFPTANAPQMGQPGFGQPQPSPQQQPTGYPQQFKQQLGVQMPQNPFAQRQQ